MRRSVFVVVSTLMAVASCGGYDDVTEWGPPPIIVPRPVDAGRDSRASLPADEPPCPALEVATAAELEAEIGWKSARVDRGACSDDELARVIANLSDPATRLWTDIAMGVGERCAACVVTRDTDPQWGFVVVTTYEGAAGFFDYGACAAAIAGDACGRARLYEDLCVREACEQCSGGKGGHDECVRDAPSDSCSSFADEHAAACGDAGSACASAEDSLRVLCSGPKDANGG